MTNYQYAYTLSPKRYIKNELNVLIKKSLNLIKIEEENLKSINEKTLSFEKTGKKKLKVDCKKALELKTS